MSTRAPVARLALADGSLLRGRAFGAVDRPVTSIGEVVFNTAMTGYQEALTDPSYAGQILTMTAPMIGNYGVAAEDVESSRPQVAGFVVRELARRSSNYRAVTDLPAWLSQHGVLGVEGIDTRSLVRRLRTVGAMPGVLSSDAALTDADLVDIARSAPTMNGQNLAGRVSPHEPQDWTQPLGEWGVTHAPGAGGPPLRIAALDCGGKHNIYRHLADRGCHVRVLPFDVTAEQIRELAPDGLFVSNGPGDPAAVDQTIATLRQVVDEVPTFGICLGHQLLALALGAQTFKLKFGHRGANQPVRNLLIDRVEITSQNHGFSVEPDALRRVGGEVTHINLNDGTLAGFRLIDRPLFSVQYHPEASPGPHDSAYLFDCFVEMMRTGGPVDAATMRRAVQAGAAVAGV